MKSINCYHNVEKLCIGFIIECKEGSDYGIIYQYNDEVPYSECKGSALCSSAVMYVTSWTGLSAVSEAEV
ncbi:hypothetical protein [uncultured Bacteroides sp.]|uniref:hypothetical protein n=1 Tax=uncultured Bacteroides sp. TaxID=162156 RepID=UPI0026E5203E|nr:hypothetical protein [uncultured Bacteroides sp.]